MSGTSKTGMQGSEAPVSPADADAGGPTLDRNVQAQIGDKLRTLYGELSAQPVPDRLVAIIERLGAKSV